MSSAMWCEGCGKTFEVQTYQPPTDSLYPTTAWEEIPAGWLKQEEPYDGPRYVCSKACADRWQKGEDVSRDERAEERELKAVWLKDPKRHVFSDVGKYTPEFKQAVDERMTAKHGANWRDLMPYYLQDIIKRQENA